MTTIYIVGNGTGTFTPGATASATLEVWGAGGTASSGSTAGTGAGYAKLNSFSLTASTGYSFSLGAPAIAFSSPTGGDTWLSNTGVTPTTTAQGALGNGGGSATARIGNTTNAGGSGGSAPGSGYAAGGGAGGPNGVGQAGGGCPSGGYGGGGGGNGGGTAGGNAGASAVGVGGDGFAGTGGQTAGAAGGKGAGGAGQAPFVAAPGGKGGDDYDNGGGGQGGAGQSDTGTVATYGGTPGGGGACPAGGSGGIAAGKGSGGWSLIKLVYTSGDADQLWYGGTIARADVLANMPASWNNNYTEDTVGSFTRFTRAASGFIPARRRPLAYLTR